MEDTKKLQELYNKIVQWAKDRKIIPNAHILVQAGKMVSEKSEISKAFLESNANEFYDAIGDTFVTMVNVVELAKLKGAENGLALKQIPFNGINSVADTILRLDIVTGEIVDNLIKENYTDAVAQLNVMLGYLFGLARLFNTTLDKCVELAYEQIKDRKGITLENGTFIKEDDPRYKQIVNQEKEQTQNVQEEQIEQPKQTEQENNDNKNEKQKNKFPRKKKHK